MSPGYVGLVNTQDLVNHRAQLVARLNEIDEEKSQIARKLKAIDVLLEGSDGLSHPGVQVVVQEGVVSPDCQVDGVRRRRTRASHAVRFSNRISLIGAVEECARKQPGDFDSNQMLTAIQRAYPEFNLTETKHISSPLSDLEKRGVLTLVRRREGKMSNIYRITRK